MDCVEPVFQSLLLEVKEAGVGNALQGGIAEDLEEGLMVKGEEDG